MIHFLADLHLSSETPAITRLFTNYLEEEARTAEHVFILGDLFEAWPGDDQLEDPEDAFAANIARDLRRLCERGTRVSIQRGNRDFLLGKRFAEVSGTDLLPDPYALSLDSAHFVLSHGDALCTDDTDYQAFRQQVRSSDWQDSLLQKPLTERKAIAASMRQQSETFQRENRHPPTDLNPSATENLLRHHRYATLIHGHTHCPAEHEHIVDGIRVERWVLSDWRPERGEYLAWDGHRLMRHEVL